jgi:hypothetical protein
MNTMERIETLQSECEEQARLLGMSGEREAALQVEVEILKRRVVEQDRMLGQKPCQYGGCINYGAAQRQIAELKLSVTQLEQALAKRRHKNKGPRVSKSGAGR